MHSSSLRRTPVVLEPARRQGGFTLIETMVVVSVLVIIVAVAMPSLRTFMVRNKVASVSNEFTSAMLHARSLAVSRNACVTLCAAASSNGTTCAATSSAADFNANGWLMFENPVCNAAQTVATAASGVVLQQRTGLADGYLLQGTAGGLNIVMFDPRGYANLAASGTFEVSPPVAGDAGYKRRVCVDPAGRATVRAATATC